MMLKLARPLLGVLLMMALPVASAEAAANQPCVSPQDASGLILFLAPQAIKAVTAVCGTALPATSPLHRPNGPLLVKYEAEADASWPAAKRAMGVISGDDTAALLDSDQAQPLLTAMLAPMITKEIKVKDCASIDRIVTLLEPLPARNTADLIVAIVQMSNANKEKSDLPICPAQAAQ